MQKFFVNPPNFSKRRVIEGWIVENDLSFSSGFLSGSLCRSC